MLLVKLYSTSALLLLVLSCPLWHVSQSVPVMSKGPMSESCVSYAWILLQNITDALTQNNLFSGINCTKQNVELNMKTKTTSVCAPKESKCSRNAETEFNLESCLTNIGEDLVHYYGFLAAQPDPDSLLGQTVLFSLRELMENCFPWIQLTDLASVKAAIDRPSSYDERLNLCKVLKGFQVRTITINRAIGYISSGQHAK
ncbi:interleukin-12 subunit alpha [Anabas testudineus]|uniref:interleukin-12 subunit alpha n=1 Tax=Anabas testudineus TaxID=64144 RepID=UPI000E45551E|nr:interleukin-12 subunit alpha [Anabas testudineus]